MKQACNEIYLQVYMITSTITLYKNAYNGLTKRIWLLSLVMLINRSGTMVLPFMTLYCKKIGYTTQQAGWVVALYGLGAIIGAFLGGKISDNFGFYFPWGRAAYNRNLVADYVVAILFGVHVLSAQNIAQRFGERNYSCAAAIRWIGGLTFPLYCIHYPVLCFLRAVSPWGMDTWENAFFLLILMSLSVVLVGSYCDNLKMKFRYNFHKFKAN